MASLETKDTRAIHKEDKKVTAIIVAAGEGKRMRTSLPKPYLELNGIPILALTLQQFEKTKSVDEIILVVKEEFIDYTKSNIVDKFGFKKISKIVKGGGRRQDSVKVGLDLAQHEIVLIHDGVRPFVTTKLITRVIEECKRCDAVIPAIPVKETIKRIKDGYVACTLDRNELYSIQTPQAFKREILKKAHELDINATDSSSLVERLGLKVKVIEGDPKNIKITDKEDILYGRAILEDWPNCNSYKSL